MRKKCTFTEELLTESKDRKARSDGAVFDVWLGKRELERLLPISRGQVKREYFTATQEVVGGVFQSKELTTDAGNTPVERDLLAAAFRYFQVDIDRGFFFVRPEVRVFVFINRLEVAALIELDD